MLAVTICDYYCGCGGDGYTWGTLWHLPKFLQCIIVEFTPSIILLYPPLLFKVFTQWQENKKGVMSLQLLSGVVLIIIHHAE
jgi:hypothetical protein